MKQIKLLAVSFCYPPLAYPRSIQVARLLKHIDSATVLVSGDETGVRHDFTIEPESDTYLDGCLRVRFDVSPLRKIVGRASRYLQLPLLDKVPDARTPWKNKTLRAIKDYMVKSKYLPDVMVTFGHPMTDHLVGLALKNDFKIPWIAHFSDPWADNPFIKSDPITKAANLSLERKVIQAADRIIFTSQETIDLVMAKYPETWKRKVCVLPHSFDPERYSNSQQSIDRITIRYLGDLYGLRTPNALLQTLEQIVSSDIASLSNVNFELVGSIDRRTFSKSRMAGLPKGLLSMKSPVSYQESIQLMSSADGLLIIDAPIEKSVFLPSKLIDYIGAGRPILALTPPGVSSGLVKELGGWVAHTNEVREMVEITKNYISYLRKRKTSGFSVWGDQGIRGLYTVNVVAKRFESIIQELLSREGVNH